MQLDALGGLLAVPPLDGVGDDLGQLAAVALDREDHGVRGQPVEPLAQRGLVHEPAGEPLQLGAHPQPHRALGIVEGVGQRVPQRLPQRDRRGDDLGAVQQPLLERLGAGHGARVVLQVLRELAQHGVQGGAGPVTGLVADVGDPADQLEVDARGDPVVDRRRRPPRGALADHLGHGVGVVDQPAVQLLQRQVDEPVVEVVAHRLRKQVAQQR